MLGDLEKRIELQDVVQGHGEANSHEEDVCETWSGHDPPEHHLQSSYCTLEHLPLTDKFSFSRPPSIVRELLLYRRQVVPLLRSNLYDQCLRFTEWRLIIPGEDVRRLSLGLHMLSRSVEVSLIIMIL